MMAYDKRVMRVSEFLRERCWGLTLERERKRKSARSRTILRKRRKRTAHEKKKRNERGENEKVKTSTFMYLLWHARACSNFKSSCSVVVGTSLLFAAGR